MKLVNNTRDIYPEFDSVEEMQSCLDGFNELLYPDPTIDANGRDKIAVLLQYLLAEQHRRMEALRQEVVALKSQRHG